MPVWYLVINSSMDYFITVIGKVRASKKVWGHYFQNFQEYAVKVSFYDCHYENNIGKMLLAFFKAPRHRIVELQISCSTVIWDKIHL